MQGAIGIVMAAIFLVAGCVGESGTSNAPRSSSPTAPAPTPTVDDLSGSVSGVVADDESRPLSGVKAALVEANMETVSDAGGRFTFNEVTPGSYRLITERLGYEAVARKIDVRAGEVTEVTITLKALRIDAEPYYRVVPKVAHFQADNWFVSQYLDHLVVYTNVSAFTNLRCNPCWFVLHVEPNPSAIQSDVQWTASGNPAINPDVQLWYKKDWSESTSGTTVCGYFVQTNKATRPWSEACVTGTKNIDKIKLYLLGSAYGVSVDHRVNTWTTFGYNGDLPDEYTALPPG